MNRSLLLILGAALTFGACNGDDDPASESGSESGSESESESEVEAPIISISGLTREVASGDPATDTHCVQAVDPSAALDGGELTVLSSATVNADGTYLIEDIDVRLAPLAIFLILTDCDMADGTVFPSATGFAAETYSSAEAGDSFESVMLYVGADTADGLNASLALIGSDATLDDGSVMAFIQDSSGAPLGGATLTCGDCGPTYYVNPASETGLLGSGPEDINEATIPGVGLAFIPGGPVGAYQASADGYAFEAGLFGSLPGIAAFTAFRGTDDSN